MSKLTITGTGDPNGSVTAGFEGQHYKDDATDDMYVTAFSSGTVWTKIGGGGGGGSGVVATTEVATTPYTFDVSLGTPIEYSAYTADATINIDASADLPGSDTQYLGTITLKVGETGASGPIDITFGLSGFLVSCDLMYIDTIDSVFEGNYGVTSKVLSIQNKLIIYDVQVLNYVLDSDNAPGDATVIITKRSQLSTVII